jgi:hypothetical protein
VRFRFNDQRDRPPRSVRVLCTASLDASAPYNMLNYPLSRVSTLNHFYLLQAKTLLLMPYILSLGW